MNFKQLVTETTRPVSATCLDRILSNKPQCMHNIVIPDIGLLDDLPVFAVRQYSCNSEQVHPQMGHVYIKYRNMKTFNEAHFKCTLKETPWDSVFVFEDIDDILSAWETLFNDALDLNCPWQIKRVKQVNNMPWLAGAAWLLN